MEEKIELIKKHLTEIGDELFRKYGTDSYQLRCMIYDVKDSVSKLHQPDVIVSACKCNGGAVGRTLTADFEHQICEKCGKIAS